VEVRFEGHQGIISDIDYASSGKSLASASEDGTIRIWHTDSGREELRLRVGDAATSVTFSNDGLLLAGASEDNSVRIWLAQTGDLIAHLPGGQKGVFVDNPLMDGHINPVWHIAFDMCGTALFSASLDKTVKIWEGFQTTHDGANMAVKTLKGHKVYFNHLSHLFVWAR